MAVAGSDPDVAPCFGCACHVEHIGILPRPGVGERDRVRTEERRLRSKWRNRWQVDRAGQADKVLFSERFDLGPQRGKVEAVAD